MSIEKIFLGLFEVGIIAVPEEEVSNLTLSGLSLAPTNGLVGFKYQAMKLVVDT
jgi:hypothetical protein